jgi:hypothetical protein
LLPGLLIQGPLHVNVLKNILINPFFTEIVVSTWRPQNDMERQLLWRVKKLGGVRVIVNEIGAEKSYVCPEALSKQVYTTLQGLS